MRLYPGPLSQVIEGMDSILRMPGGCFEQTSSSTYPNVLALDYMKRTKKLTPEVHAKAEGYIANGYQRLLTFEVPGGGFSWFGNAPANKILTSYGLMEFCDMSKVHDVDPKAHCSAPSSGWPRSSRQMEAGSRIPISSTKARPIATTPTCCASPPTSRGRSRTPATRARRSRKAKQFIEKHMNAGKLDAYTLAVLANFAADYGNDRRVHAPGNATAARRAHRERRASVVERRGNRRLCHGRQRQRGNHRTRRAGAAQIGRSHQAQRARRSPIIASKKDARGTWGTTQATIMALRALLLATGKGAADVRGTLEVMLNGKPVEKLTLTAREQRSAASVRLQG